MVYFLQYLQNPLYMYTEFFIFFTITGDRLKVNNGDVRYASLLLKLLQTLKRIATPLPRNGTKRFLNGTVTSLHRTLRDFHRAVNGLHKRWTVWRKRWTNCTENFVRNTNHFVGVAWTLCERSARNAGMACTLWFFDFIWFFLGLVKKKK